MCGIRPPKSLPYRGPWRGTAGTRVCQDCLDVRWATVYYERQAGRSFSDIASNLGLSVTRARTGLYDWTSRQDPQTLTKEFELETDMWAAGHIETEELSETC